MIPIVIGALGIITKGCVKGLGRLENKRTYIRKKVLQGPEEGPQVNIHLDSLKTIFKKIPNWKTPALQLNKCFDDVGETNLIQKGP